MIEDTNNDVYIGPVYKIERGIVRFSNGRGFWMECFTREPKPQVGDLVVLIHTDGGYTGRVFNDQEIHG
jgi:hypothetical protein